jgi:xanthine dehydrogenase molybdopterin-binding subunit B
MTQATQDPHSCQSARYSYTCPYLWSQLYLVAAKQNYAHGRVNHVVVEETQEAPGVVIGMFLVDDTSVVVMFDSVASHSFISAAYVGKHNLP